MEVWRSGSVYEHTSSTLSPQEPPEDCLSASWLAALLAAELDSHTVEKKEYWLNPCCIRGQSSWYTTHAGIQTFPSQWTICIATEINEMIWGERWNYFSMGQLSFMNFSQIGWNGRETDFRGFYCKYTTFKKGKKIALLPACCMYSMLHGCISILGEHHCPRHLFSLINAA